MNRKINKLCKIEGEIVSCYTTLCGCEIDADYEEYFEYVYSMLQYYLGKEKKILSKLADADLKYLLYIDKNCIQGANSLINKEDIAKRMYSLANDYILNKSKDINEDDTDTFIPLDSAIRRDSKQVAKEEYLNILLSFYDEHLRYCAEDRHNLSINKYRLMYENSSNRFENYMLREGLFSFEPRELNKKVEKTVRQIPKYMLDTDKRALAYSILARHSDSLFTYDVEELNNNSTILLLSFQVRSSLLLLEEKESLDFIAKLGIDEDNPWYKVLMDDREKYNDISILKYRKRKQ